MIKVRRGYDVYESKLLGPIGMVVSELGLERIFLLEENLSTYLESHPDIRRDEVICQNVKAQLEAYFLGQRRAFDIPLVLNGTPFRMQVWEALRRIPFAKTRTYGDLARMISNPKACRAVGGANRANPIPIVIPCHRVIGANGKLVGFLGEKIEIKECLLAHEKSVLDKKLK